MQQVWFKKTGWVYSPVHVMGFIITAAALAFMIPVVIAVCRGAHSVTVELYDLFVVGPFPPLGGEGGGATPLRTNGPACGSFPAGRLA